MKRTSFFRLNMILLSVCGLLSACTSTPKETRCANELRLIEPEGIDSLPRFQLKNGGKALLHFLDSMTKEANEENDWMVYFVLEDSVRVRCSFDRSSLMPNPPCVLGWRSRLDILVNNSNRVLIKGEVSHSSDVYDWWKRMLLNEGIDPNLATNPQRAVVRIKIDSLVSIDTLSQILVQVNKAHYDVRRMYTEHYFGRMLCQVPSDSMNFVFERYPLNLYIETHGMRNYAEIPIMPIQMIDSLDEPNEPE